MTAEEQKQAKRALRARVRAARDALAPEERVHLSSAVEDRLFEIPTVGRAGTVMVFSSFGSEVSTGGIIERLAEDGRRVVLPRVTGIEMEAVAYRPGDPVRTASFGAMEPAAGSAVPPEEIDLVITPGLVFDRAGYRLGYGGGHFDRFLVRVRRDAVRVGVCFDLQVVHEIPRDPWDQPVDVIVTERELIRCR